VEVEDEVSEEEDCQGHQPEYNDQVAPAHVARDSTARLS
jgi:hypothetical protein